MAEQSFARITEEGIAELRSLLDVERNIISYQNTEVCKDNIRRFQLGSGDDNPLWLDEIYAQGTCWKGIIAPPCFVRTLGIPLPQKLPGVHSQFAGEEFEFYQPIHLGERITATTRLIDLIEKESRFAMRTFHEIEEANYRNQDNVVVSRCIRTYIRCERDTAHAQGKYRDIEPATWTPGELQKFEELSLQEKRRGAIPRYWEDVKTDEELPPIIRGPLTVTDMVWHFLAEGGVPFSYGIGLCYKMRKRQPAWFIINSQGAYEGIVSCHWDWNFAKRIGVPGPYDTPAMRSSCIAHMISDWMGDDGWLKGFAVQSRRFMIQGDIVWYKGKVVDKYVREGQHLVKLEIWGENQRNEQTTLAHAEVVLPSSQA